MDQLTELAAECPLPVNPQVVLARSREEGFRYALQPESTVLVGTHRHFWRTSEERLARMLARRRPQGGVAARRKGKKPCLMCCSS